MRTPPNSVFGRWKRTHLPSIRCGSSAAFLSSGCRMIPWRSTRREVLGRREEDGRAGRAVGGAGDHPALELGDEDDARVLEAPLLALDAVRRARAAAPGRSIQPSTPLRGAGDREVRDARSGPRRGRAATVAPSTLRRGRVEDGVDRIRPVVRRQDRVGRVAVEELAACSRRRTGLARRADGGTAGRPAVSSSSAARWKASVDSAPSLSFVVSSPSPSLQPPVAKSYSGRWSRLRPRNQSNARCARSAVLRIAGDGEGGELGLDECGRVERLLVAVSRSRLGATPAAVAGQPKRALGEPGLVAEPAERVEARLGQIVAAERDAADDQRVRQPGVVVGERVLEPVPASAPSASRRRRRAARRTRSSSCRASGSSRSGSRRARPRAA